MNNYILSIVSTLIITSSYAAFATEDNSSIETIVVTATGNPQTALLAPATLSVITREDLLNNGDQQLTSALRKSSGISLVGRGVGGRKVIQLRGLESKHTLILIDSKRISATDDVVGHSDFQYDWLPLDSIERIEIIRGPMSSLYGSDALGGVINIITRNSQSKANSSVSALGSLYNADTGGGQYALNAHFNQPITEDLSWNAHIGHKYQDDVLDDEQPHLSLLEGRRLNTLKTGLHWAANSIHTLSVDYTLANEERWQHVDSRGQEPFYRSWYDIKREQIAASWKADFQHWSSQLNLYRSQIDLLNKADDTTVSTYAPQSLKDDIAELKLFRDFGRSRLTLGADYRDEQLIHDAFINGGDNAKHKSALAQYETDIQDTFFLTFGARLDHHEYFGSEWSPRAYAVWQINTDLTIKAGYGHGFKAPTLKQISPYYRFDGPHSFIGNEHLKPETSDSFEVGLRYESTKVTTSATVFHNRINDLISTVCIENCDSRLGRVNLYTNVEQSEITGFELENSIQATSQLQFYTNYTYTDAKDKTANQALTGRPRHQATLGLNIAWVPQAWHSSINWQYIGKQYTADITELITLPSYNLTNATLSYLYQQHRLTLSINNIFDVNLLEKSENYGYQEYGRSLLLGWQWNF